MAQTFHITPAATFSQLDACGTGNVAFTITNASSKPVRAWPEIKPLGSTQREWLGIEGQAERSFSANEAHTFTISIKVPPGTVAGTYEFKLNVINADKGDLDGCTEGPAVKFAVEQAAPPAPPKKGLWIAAAVLVLLVVGAVAMLLSPKKEVKARLTAADLPTIDDTKGSGSPDVNPLIVRGGPTLRVSTKPSGDAARPVTIVVGFTPFAHGAGPPTPEDAMQPGYGSWLYRSLRPLEPRQIECNLTDAEADVLPRLLARPDVYYAFACYPTDKGYMKATAATGHIIQTQ